MIRRICILTVLAAFCMGAHAVPPQGPLDVELDVVNNVVSGAGGSVSFQVKLTARRDLPQTTLQVALSPALKLVSGAAAWQGVLGAGAPVVLDFEVGVMSAGKHSVTVTALCPFSQSVTWSDGDSYFFSTADAVGMTVGHGPAQTACAAAAYGFAARGMDAPVELPKDTRLPGAVAYTTPNTLSGLSLPAAPGAPSSGGTPNATEPRASMTVTGTWGYVNRSGVVAGQQYAYVRITMEDGSYLGEGYCNANGSYSITIASAPVGNIRSWYYAYTNLDTGNQLMTIPNNTSKTDLNNVYKVYSGTVAAAAGTVNIGSWNTGSSNNVNRAWWILSDLIRSYCRRTNSIYAGPGAVEWQNDSTVGTYYQFGGNIHLMANDPLSYHTVIHEYGHNVMWNVYGSYFPPTSCPSPHYMFEDEEQGCAWTEGWANGFCAIVSDDPVFKWASGGSSDLENRYPGDGLDEGDDVEGRIAGALYDLYDSQNDGQDIYSLGFGTIWDTITSLRSTTYSDWYADWQSRGGNEEAFRACSKQNTIDYWGGATSNNNFADRYNIAGSNGAATGSNAGANKESGEPNHGGFTGGASVWWKWTAPSSGQVTIDTIGSSFDTLLGVYTGTSVSALTSIAQDDDSGGNRTSKATFTASSGTVYNIAVDGYSAATGNITLNWAMGLSANAPVVFNIAYNDCTGGSTAPPTGYATKGSIHVGSGCTALYGTDFFGNALYSGWLGMSYKTPASPPVLFTIAYNDCTGGSTSPPAGYALRGSIHVGSGCVAQYGTDFYGNALKSGWLAMAYQSTVSPPVVFRVAHDDCTGISNPPPTGYTMKGSIHVGSGCTALYGTDFYGTQLKSGWMGMCYRNDTLLPAESASAFNLFLAEETNTLTAVGAPLRSRGSGEAVFVVREIDADLGASHVVGVSDFADLREGSTWSTALYTDVKLHKGRLYAIGVIWNGPAELESPVPPAAMPQTAGRTVGCTAVSAGGAEDPHGQMLAGFRDGACYPLLLQFGGRIATEVVDPLQ